MSEKTYNISKCSERKSASDFERLRPVCKFLESSNSKRKKSYAQFFLILFKSGQTMVKLLIQEVLVLLNNYSRILVLLNNYFSFFEFWSTMVKLLIQEILVLLNNYFSFFEFWSNLVKLWSNYGQTTYSRNISVTA